MLVRAIVMMIAKLPMTKKWTDLCESRADTPVQCHILHPIEGVQSFIWNHWMPPSSKYSPCIATWKKMVKKHHTTWFWPFWWPWCSAPVRYHSYHLIEGIQTGWSYQANSIVADKNCNRSPISGVFQFFSSSSRYNKRDQGDVKTLIITIEWP